MKLDAAKLAARPQRLLRDGMIAAVARHPDKVALVIEGKSYTYAELLDAASRLAQALIQRGVKKGDRVAIYMDNTWPCVVSIYATLLAGAVFLVINPQTKADKLEFILDDSDAILLLTDVHLATVFSDAVKANTKLNGIISSGDLSQAALQLSMSVEAFDAVIEQSESLAEPVNIIPNDLAALIYTSGSTGFPKGVMQTHQAMVFAAWSLIEYQRLTEDHRIILVLPIAFDYGLYQLIMTMKLGATLIVERSFTFPAQVYKRIEEFGATVFPGVPTIFAMMISSHKKKPLRIPGITRITNTAAALPADFVPYLKEIFPNALIYKMYGLTECKRVSYLEPELVDAKLTSVGKAIPGTEMYLLTPEGQPVPPGETGILHVRGPHVMVGYWKQPELSAKMLKPGKLPGERVLCTQDWFRTDKEGFFYFVGRSDDIIKTRGEKVSPVEVENVLHSMPQIKEAAVIGVPDDVFGQSVKAFVALEKDAELNDKQIKKFCMAHLENYMVPKDIVFMEELPKTANGKIDKKLLMQGGA
ncbi:MAG TPA: class I adenylate-forming enzyme family protein [Gammaproteobacteria bacterium]